MKDIKFRAWVKGERYTRDYVNWCKHNKYPLGGNIVKLKKQRRKYQELTGKSHTEKYAQMEYNVNVSDEGKLMELEYDTYHGDNHNAILMQYTGQKDKDGNELYEGDVIDIYLSEFPQTEPIRWRGVIEWINDNAKFEIGVYDNKGQLFTTFPLLIDDTDIREKVGNIYEK